MEEGWETRSQNHTLRHMLTEVQDETVKMKSAMVELVKGYGVMLTRRQLDEVCAASTAGPTKMMRALLSVFFKEEVLACSSCYGTTKAGANNKGNQPLDGDIVAACIKFVQDKYTNTERAVGKAVLVETINDKCAQVRRKLKNKSKDTSHSDVL
ncbi:uncharacterized protein [Dysidea avara]|uniref:uncharacterized protein isoform X1 n=1 Tax=Dysidea avara TaxID=196820 RepID=UPI00332C28F2